MVLDIYLGEDTHKQITNKLYLLFVSPTLLARDRDPLSGRRNRRTKYSVSTGNRANKIDKVLLLLKTSRSPRLKTSSCADLATPRSCHSDPGTNIQTTSFGPSLPELSNCFPVGKCRYMSYSTILYNMSYCSSFFDFSGRGLSYIAQRVAKLVSWIRHLKWIWVIYEIYDILCPSFDERSDEQNQFSGHHRY